ncbi:hypothetical protein WR25_01111 [Diploscapter pachys]|uniref:Uncharacterized protein n=1 Tax=Diploscapter pachys TaxID=2018661 RepID=A0A2A2LIY9_9BILA|nr:hypothetical protein WR25_01111 [Diploscapter pachys]
MKVKTEVIDLSYEDSVEVSRSSEVDSDSEAMLVAQRIKEEFDEEKQQSENGRSRPKAAVSSEQRHYESQFSRYRPHSSSSRSQTPQHTSQSSGQRSNGHEQKPPLVFDHFICMRIGLNSHNNVQRLMALLAAHDFVDLTVLPSPAPSLAPLIQTPPALPLPFHQALSFPLISLTRPASFPTTSKPPDIVALDSSPTSSVSASATATVTATPTPLTSKQLHPPQSKKHSKRITKVHHLGGDGHTLPVSVKCKKCGESIQKGLSASIALNHVQKAHLKMAAFQCRILINSNFSSNFQIQSHVTTVHKARSSKFDDTLAGPLSAADMRKMEQMITKCFPALEMELEITDKLVVRKVSVTSFSQD